MTFRRSGILAGNAGVLFAGLLFSLTATATNITDDLSLRGFYTLDLTYSDSDGAELPGPKEQVPFKEGETSLNNSLIGLQANYSLSENLDFTLQAISTHRTDDSYEPTVEWAYLKYDLGDDLYLRGGKMKLSLLQGIELRPVGFSRLWARPLIPNSGAGGFDDFFGAEIIKSSTLGDYNTRLQASYGVADHRQDFVEDRDIEFLSARLEKNESWVNVAALHALYEVATPSGIKLDHSAELLMGSIEAELLLGNTVINAGYAYGDAEFNPDEQLAYLSLGYHFERITPYLLLSQRRMVFNADELMAALPPPPPPPPPPALPPPPPPDGEQKTDSISLGFRYDLGPTYAIKAQWEHWQRSDETAPLGGTVKSDGNLFTLVFEGVF